MYVRSWGWEDPLEEEMATHTSILAWSTPWTAACQALLSLTVSQSSLRFMSIELVMLSNHLILCHPLLLCLSLSQYQGIFQ